MIRTPSPSKANRQVVPYSTRGRRGAASGTSSTTRHGENDISAPLNDLVVSDSPSVAREIVDTSVLYRGAMVHVLVGAEEEDFSVHKNLICHHSRYFDSMFNRAWIESAGSAKLPELSAAVFALFNQWMYTKQIFEPGHLYELEHGLYKDQSLLLQVWVFADMAFIPKLQNAAIITLNDSITSTNRIWVSHLKYIFQNTREDSLLRTFMLDSFVWTSDLSKLDFAQVDCAQQTEIICALMGAANRLIQLGKTGKLKRPISYMNKYLAEEI